MTSIYDIASDLIYLIDVLKIDCNAKEEVLPTTSLPANKPYTSQHFVSELSREKTYTFSRALISNTNGILTYIFFNSTFFSLSFLGISN